MGKFQDLTGQQFGRLTVMNRAEDHIPPSGRPQVRWHCRCECGNEVDAAASGLKKGTTTSCGCYRIERVAAAQKAKMIDLTGQVFTKLTVMYRAEDYISLAGKRFVRWHCKCECGNEVDVIASKLKSGYTKSCGCYHREVTSKQRLIDLTGQRFGQLYVVCRAKEEKFGTTTTSKRVKWHCRCDCGNEVDVTADSLVGGKSKSCGCKTREWISEKKLHNLTGQRFGRLTVIERAPNLTYGLTRWRCRCDCGSETVVQASDLKNGNIVSCGCYNKEVASARALNDMTGKVFGKLKVLYRVDDYVSPMGKRVVRWHCKCECGNEVDVPITSLQSGSSTSCGCISSKLEYHVIQYFNECNYKAGKDYEYQKYYNDLTGVGGGKLRYDFLVYKDGVSYCFVECQGVQHSRPVDLFGGEDQYEIQQFHDELKREYAESLGIPLLEISHTSDTYEKVVELLRKAGI